MKQYNRFDGDDEVMDAPQGSILDEDFEPPNEACRDCPCPQNTCKGCKHYK